VEDHKDFREDSDRVRVTLRQAVAVAVALVGSLEADVGEVRSTRSGRLPPDDQ
jgi:hypothetical protein